MKSWVPTCSLILTLILSMGISPSEARMFSTVPGDSKNVIQFTSVATLETVVGRTSDVQGHLDIDVDSLAAARDGLFEVDLNSLDTGIAMRNKDMQRSFLETSKFPTATFRLRRIVEIDKPVLQAGETAHATVEGDFTVHGTTKQYQIPVTIAFDTYNPVTEKRLDGSTGDILVINGEWNIRLTDHDIQRPQLLFMRLAEVQRVNVSIALTDVPAPKK